MIEFLRGWIINIVTISIMLILFEIIVPSGKVKKIISLVAGFVLLIAVINPFLTLKNKNFDLGEAAISDSAYIDKKEIENSSKVLEETQMKQISVIYKKKLINRIEEETCKIQGITEAKAQVEINEDYSSEKYGEITKITVNVKKGEKQNDNNKVTPVVSIEKVEVNSTSKINSASDSNTDTKTLKAADPEAARIAELIKKNLNKTLEVSQDSIVVTVDQ